MSLIGFSLNHKNPLHTLGFFVCVFAIRETQLSHTDQEAGLSRRPLHRFWGNLCKGLMFHTQVYLLKRDILLFPHLTRGTAFSFNAFSPTIVKETLIYSLIYYAYMYMHNILCLHMLTQGVSTLHHHVFIGSRSGESSLRACFVFRVGNSHRPQ